MKYNNVKKNNHPSSVYYHGNFGGHGIVIISICTKRRYD